MKRMVVGFVFNASTTAVMLIRKVKPEWQCGLLNGIGGKIEQGESTCGAMRRECLEEAGIDIDIWTWVHKLSADDWEVDFFACCADLSMMRSMEVEQLEVIMLSDINPLRVDMINNLPWLIPMARWTLNT